MTSVKGKILGSDGCLV